MSAALQDALARLERMQASWDDLRQAMLRANYASPDCIAILDFCRRSLDDAVVEIRVAHSLPCSAASSAAPPAAVPPCAAGLTAGASSDAPAL
jgi:hypothetical protein